MEDSDPSETPGGCGGSEEKTNLRPQNWWQKRLLECWTLVFRYDRLRSLSCGMAAMHLSGTGPLGFVSLSQLCYSFLYGASHRRLTFCQDSIHPTYSASLSIVLTCLLYTPLGPDHPWCASGNALTDHCACVSTWWNTVLCHFWLPSGSYVKSLLFQSFSSYRPLMSVFRA